MHWFDVRSIDVPPADFLREVGEIFAVFDVRTQDSANVSYGVRVKDQRFFVKTAGSPDIHKPISHATRVALLHNAVALYQSISSPLLPELHGVIDSPNGPMLVYAWSEGELLHASRQRRSELDSAFQRFCSLSLHDILDVLDRVFSLHVDLAAEGWVACDFYDGCFLYDFGCRTVHLVDLDLYHRGPFVNQIGRMFGSSRFMAPEEFQRGATIDQRTTVFNLGRAALVFLAGGALVREAYRGSDVQHGVLQKACAEHPRDRFQSVAAFYRAWHATMSDFLT